MKNYNWFYKKANPFAVKELTDNGVPVLLATILANRGVSFEEYEEIVNGFWFMNGDYIKGVRKLEEAAARYLDAVEDKDTRIFVFSDYDADGVTSAAIINDYTRALMKALKITDTDKFSVYLPNRSEGYGLSMAWSVKLAEDYKKEPGKKYIVFTFDNGITKNSEIEFLKSNGIEVVVTDHHEPGRNLPNCLYVDPKATERRFGDELCGAGIAWLLISCIYASLIEGHRSEAAEETVESLQRCLALAAIGTVTDMMPMTTYNLSLVRKGLELLNEGIYYPVRRLQECFGIKEITAKDIGFSIGPAINSCGQMGDIEMIYKLFSLEDETEINAQADKVYKLYEDNRMITKEAKGELAKAIEEDYFADNRFCIYTVDGVPNGIVGKISNQLTQDTGKPSIVILDADDESNEVNGSARCSNPSVDLLALLKPLEEKGLIKSAAGHKAACGVTLYKDKLDEVQLALDSKVAELEAADIIRPNTADLYIDSDINIKDINLSTFKEIISMPYSMNFTNPVFKLSADIVAVSHSKNNPRNVKYSLSQDGRQTDIWAWNIKPEAYKPEHSRISIVGTLSRNFMNPKYITMDVIDIAFS